MDWFGGEFYKIFKKEKKRPSWISDIYILVHHSGNIAVMK